MLWRDAAITAVMWGAFVLLLQRELGTGWHEIVGWLDRPGEQINEDIQEFVTGRRPAAWSIIVLVTALGVATLVSIRRRHRSLRQKQPQPVPDELLAAAIGLDEQQLEKLRLEKIVTLDVDAEGVVQLGSISCPETDN